MMDEFNQNRSLEYIAKEDFFSFCKNYGFEGNSRLAWQSLDKDEGGSITADEFHLESALILAQFRQFFFKLFNCKEDAVQRVFQSEYSGALRQKLNQDEFVHKMKELGFYPKINMMEESNDSDIVGATWNYKYTIGEKKFNLGDADYASDKAAIGGAAGGLASLAATKDELAEQNDNYARAGEGLVQGLTEVRAQHKIQQKNAKFSNDFTGKMDVELQATEKKSAPRSWVAKHAKL